MDLMPNAVNNVLVIGSRIWVCTRCGMKLYYAKVCVQPQQRCRCGNTAWKARKYVSIEGRR